MERRVSLHSPDSMLLMIVAVLILGGLIMLFSASFFMSSTYTDDPSYFFNRQLLWATLGGVGLLVLTFVDYHRWQKVSLVFLGGVVVVLLLLLVRKAATGDTESWLLGGSVQPSEFAKLALVIYMAAWLPQKGENIRNFLNGTIPFALIVAVVGGLVALQPDFGTAIVLVTMAAAVFFIAGADLGQLSLTALAGASVLGVMLRSLPEKMGRFNNWWDPFLGDCQGDTYQMCQALIALGSGGIKGLGLGASRQKFLWLPLAHTDAIYAIIGEELGMIGALGVMALYAVFIYRGFRIALAAPDRFGSLLATGVTCWITLQAVVNMGGITASMPFTGVPLPFISYGGSSLVTCLAGVGLLANVSRQTVPQKATQRAWFQRMLHANG